MTPITETIRVKLEALHFTGIQAVTPYGQDERVFTVNFDRHVDADLMASFQSAGCDIREPGENAVAVLVPADWIVAPDVQLNTTSDSTVQVLTADNPIVKHIFDELIRLGNKVDGAYINPYNRGKDCSTGDCYIIIFKNADDIVTFEGHAFASLFRNGNRMVVVGIPADWKQVEAATPADDELTETAMWIKRLQHRIAELAEDKEHLEKRVETLVDERDELIEQRDSAIAMASVADDLRAEQVETALEGRALLNPCKEVVTKRSVSDSELQKMLNEGWNIQHMQFQDVALHVVFIRDLSAPTPSPQHMGAWRLIEPIPGTHQVYPPVTPFSIPDYDMPLGLTHDERVEYRVNQIKAAAQDYIRAQVTGEQS